MIAILVSAALIGQTGAFDSGAKIRHESNKMLMGIHNVPYDVADVLNGSNYSVEQATEIAAQRRQLRAIQERKDFAALQKQLHTATKTATKQWAALDKFYGKIIDGSLVLPDQERPTARGHIRTDIESTTLYITPPFSNTFSRNVRNAAKAHIKKAEAALAVLDKQGSPPEEKKDPVKRSRGLSNALSTGIIP